MGTIHKLIFSNRNTTLQCCFMVLTLFVSCKRDGELLKSLDNFQAHQDKLDGLSDLYCRIYSWELPLPYRTSNTSAPLYLYRKPLRGGNDNLLNNNILQVNRTKIGLFFGILGLSIVYISGVTCNMQSSSFSPCYPLSFIIASLGFIFVYIIAFGIQKNRVLSWLGINSLAIMLMHEPVKRIVIKVYSIIIKMPVDTIRESALQSFIITSVTLILLFPMVMFINKYVPFLLGKTHKMLKTANR